MKAIGPLSITKATRDSTLLSSLIGEGWKSEESNVLLDHHPPELQDVGPRTYMLFLHRCSDFMCRIHSIMHRLMGAYLTPEGLPFSNH